MEAIQMFLGKVKLGGKQNHLNMTLFPLLASDAVWTVTFTPSGTGSMPEGEGRFVPLYTSQMQSFRLR